MITDSQTNKLYLADCLPEKQRAFFQRFQKVLAECRIDYDILPNTRDIWARDFMPVQFATDRFVQFVYNPDYLHTISGQKTISDGKAICQKLGIDVITSDIVLDGGNVVKSSDKVILTDKVFCENPTYERKALRKELEKLFQIDHLYIVPQPPHDFTGHADGIVRFLDDRTVLICDYAREEDVYERALLDALDNAGLDYIPIPYNPYGNKGYTQANGIYINYLQMKDVVILPVFGQKEDDDAVKRFAELFDGYTVKTVESNEIAEKGGILNCISWSIKTLN